jgi:hypothetical protein
MDVEGAIGTKGANVKGANIMSCLNGNKAVKCRERTERPFGADNILRIFDI